MSYSRPPITAYILPLALGLLAAACASIAIVANLDFATSVAAKAGGHATAIAGAASVTADIAAVLLALAVGALIARRRWIAGGVVGLTVILFASWSLVSNVGYSAVTRIAPMQAAVASAEMTAATREEARQRQASAVADQIKWLRIRSTDVTLPRSAREQAVTELREMVTASTAWAASPVTVEVAPDAQSVVLVTIAGRLGVRLSEEDVQLGMATLMAALLVVGKVIGGMSAGLLWPTAIPETAVERRERVVRRVMDEAVAAAQVAPAEAVNDDEPVAEADETSRPVVVQVVEVDRVAGWVGEHLVVNGGQQAISSSLLYDIYSRMTGSDMSQRTFGRRVTEVLGEDGWERMRFGALGHSGYRGLVLSPEASAVREEIEATLASVASRADVRVAA